MMAKLYDRPSRQASWPESSILVSDIWTKLFSCMLIFIFLYVKWFTFYVVIM